MLCNNPDVRPIWFESDASCAWAMGMTRSFSFSFPASRILLAIVLCLALGVIHAFWAPNTVGCGNVPANARSDVIPSTNMMLGSRLAGTSFSPVLPPRVAIVTANMDAARQLELVTLLKSVLLHARCGLHFDFLYSNSSDADHVRSFFMAVHSPSPAITYSLVRIPLDRIANVLLSWNATIVHHAGYYGAAKFFLPDILPGVRRTMFLDTDMVAGTDLCQLWDEFDLFDEHTLLALPLLKDRQYDSHCSCVGLADLEKMRHAGWTWDRNTNQAGLPSSGVKLNLKAILVKATSQARGAHSDLKPWPVIGVGDQTLFSAVWHAMSPSYRTLIKPMPDSWNLLCSESKNRFYGVTPLRGIQGLTWDNAGDAAEILRMQGLDIRKPTALASGSQDALFHGLLHYNCPASMVPPEWAQTMKFYHAYRLAWLNAGRSTHSAQEIEV